MQTGGAVPLTVDFRLGADDDVAVDLRFDFFVLVDPAIPFRTEHYQLISNTRIDHQYVHGF